tara:strand:+ start:266 stop:547 length:282 start_codon:yes stop_codon:yes gene_type:complete
MRPFELFLSQVFTGFYNCENFVKNCTNSYNHLTGWLSIERTNRNTFHQTIQSFYSFKNKKNALHSKPKVENKMSINVMSTFVTAILPSSVKNF